MNIKNKIFNEDCLEGIKKIPNDAFDIIICDPPYNIGKNFGNDSDKQNHADYIEWVKLWLLECQRVIKRTGTIFIYGFDEILAYISVLLPMEQQRWIIWHYTNKNVPSLNFWQRSHESIICYWRDKPIFNRDAVRVPYTDGFLKGSAGRIRPLSKTARFGGEKQTVYEANPNGALPRDVICESTLAGGAALKERIIYSKSKDCIIDPKQRTQYDERDLIMHPTQKPLELTDKLIKSCRPASDFNVLIPFCGSGSECIAVLQNEGNFTAFEINPEYILLASKNVEKYQKDGKTVMQYSYENAKIKRHTRRHICRSNYIYQ
ncbi:MAG: site-specific DNA-methyltransferase [Endomicrobium sp.]|jgi:site-specific DNA-methyltransferase (adenine-specific)|nr:site-specific DNA-methyltransferase [Endomicrobium sp.]